MPRAGTVVERVNPLTKVVVVLCAAIIGFLSGPWYLLGFALAVLVAVALNRKLKAFLKLFAIAIVPAGLFIFILDIIAFKSGPVLWRWWVLAVTQGGLDAAWHFTQRFLMIGLAVMAVTFTGNLRYFARDLEQRGVSSRVTYVIQSTALILPQIVGRGSVIMDAQRARGIETDANLAVRLKALLPSAAPLILSTLTGVAERAVSLEARGMTLSGPRTSLLEVPDSGADKVVRWLAVAALLAYLIWRVWR